MPVVPVEHEAVQSAPIKTVYQSSEGATPGLFGGDQAKALQQGGAQLAAAGHDLMNVAVRQQIEDNDREVKKLDVAYQSELLRLGMGTKDAPGYYTTNGDDAVQGYEAHVEATAEARRKISEGVTNKRVLETFSAQADQRDLQESRTRSAHVDKQREVANDAMSSARIAGAAVEASTYPNDPKRVQDALEVIENEASAFADRKGIVGEARTFEILKAQGAAVTGAVKSALAQEDQVTANALFAQHFDKLNPEQRVVLATAIRENGIDARAQQLSDQVRSMGLSPADARAWIEKNAKPGKDRTKAMEVYNSSVGAERSDQAYALSVSNHAWAEYQRVSTIDKRVQEQAQQAAYDKAYGLVDKGGTVWDLPPAERMLLDRGQITTLTELAQQRATGQPVVTDDAKYEHYFGLSDEQTVAVDIAEAAKHLSASHLEQLRVKKRNAVEGAKDQKIADELFSEEANMLKLVGTDNTDERGRFRRTFNDEVNLARSNKGDKNLSREELKKILDNLVDTRIPGKLWGDTSLAKVSLDVDETTKAREALRGIGLTNPTQLQIVRAAREKAYVPALKADRDKAKAELQKRGQPLTERDIAIAIEILKSQGK